MSITSLSPRDAILPVDDALARPAPDASPPASTGPIADQRPANRTDADATRAVLAGLGPVVAFALPFALYLWVGLRISSAGLVPGDALTRTADASASWFSRDPHLEALGFVWSPLPALAQVPLVLLGRVWRPIITEGFGAVIVSALFMAWSVTAVRRWLADLEIQPALQVVLLTAYAAHPLILLSGSNGMSESALVCCCVLAALHLGRWLDSERHLDLLRAGVALAAAYLCRYEAIASIVASVAVVAWVSYRRAGQRGDDRWADARLRCAVVGLPPVAAVLGWAFVSWAIVGEPFGHFTSRYGNAEQVRAGASGIIAEAGALSGLPRAGYFAVQLLVFSASGMVAAAVLAWWGTAGGRRIAAAAAALGGPLAFQLVGAVAGTTFPMARFVVCAVPLATLLAGCAIANLVRLGLRPAGWLVAAASVTGMILSLTAVHDARLETADEAAQLSAIPAPYGTAAHRPADTIQRAGARIAADIGRLDPGHGEVLLDEATAGTMAVVLNAADQRDFVINSDRDFERVVSDPGAFGVRYLLVPDPNRSGFNALNAQFPTLYADGAGISTEVRRWTGSDGLDYRLYELLPEQRVR